MHFVEMQPSNSALNLQFFFFLAWVWEKDSVRCSTNVFEIILLLNMFLKGIPFTGRSNIYVTLTESSNSITHMFFYSYIFWSKSLDLSIII